MKKRDIHTEHCCRVHGCKYGDKDCTVWLGDLVQSTVPECCFSVYEALDRDVSEWPEVSSLRKPTFKEYAERRDAASEI